MKMMKTRMVFALSLLLFQPFCWAESTKGEAKDETKPEIKTEKNSREEITDIMNNLSYPELQVVPRASERLKIEAKDEDDWWYAQHWQMEVSGIATFAVGMQAKSNARTSLSDSQKSDEQNVANISQAVGIGWLGAGIALGALRPYRAGVTIISKYTGKDERSTLLRERLAEEALERPARIFTVLKYFSVITNVSLCVLSGTYMDNNGAVTAALGAALGFLPVLFEDRTVEIYEKHIEYKKKIYTPISTGGLIYSPQEKKLIPGAQLAWTF